jgi:hypothetical protein
LTTGSRACVNPVLKQALLLACNKRELAQEGADEAVIALTKRYDDATALLDRYALRSSAHVLPAAEDEDGGGELELRQLASAEAFREVVYEVLHNFFEIELEKDSFLVKFVSEHMMRTALGKDMGGTED